MSEQRILNEIIKSIIKEQIEAIRQIEELDSKLPWLKDVMSSLSQEITGSGTEVLVTPLEDDFIQLSFTGPAHVLFAIVNAFSGRCVSQTREKPSNPFDDSTIHLVIDTMEGKEKTIGGKTFQEL